MSVYKFVIITDDKDAPVEEQIDQGIAATWAAIHMNVMYFRRNPEDICALACGKVKYDKKNSDVLSTIGEISTAPILIKRGIGLCIDIVAFDVAVKIYEGFDAWPHIFSRGNGVFHVVTKGYGPGGEMIEYDPSLELEQRGLVYSHQPQSCRSCRI